MREQIKSLLREMVVDGNGNLQSSAKSKIDAVAQFIKQNNAFLEKWDSFHVYINGIGEDFWSGVSEDIAKYYLEQLRGFRVDSIEVRNPADRVWVHLPKGRPVELLFDWQDGSTYTNMLAGIPKNVHHNLVSINKKDYLKLMEKYPELVKPKLYGDTEKYRKELAKFYKSGLTGK